MNPELETFVELRYGRFDGTTDWFLQLPVPVIETIYDRYAIGTHGPMSGNAELMAGRIAVSLTLFKKRGVGQSHKRHRNFIYRTIDDYHNRT